MNERTSEGMNKEENKGMNEWMMNERENKGINEWINEWLFDPKAKLRALFIYTAERWSQTKFQPVQQGRMNGNPVADGWAGAVMQKPLAIQKCYGPTDRHGKV